MPTKKGLARRQSTKKSLVAASGPASYEIPGHLNPEDFKTSYVKETEALLRKLGHAKKPRGRTVRASSQPPPKGGGATFGQLYVKVGAGQARNRLGRLVTLGGVGKSAAHTPRRSSAPPRCVDFFGRHDATAPSQTHGKPPRGGGHGQPAGSGAKSGDGQGWTGCNEEGIRQVFAGFLKEFVDRCLNPNLRPAPAQLSSDDSCKGVPAAQDAQTAGAHQEPPPSAALGETVRRMARARARVP